MFVWALRCFSCTVVGYLPVVWQNGASLLFPEPAKSRAVFGGGIVDDDFEFMTRTVSLGEFDIEFVPKDLVCGAHSDQPF